MRNLLLAVLLTVIVVAPVSAESRYTRDPMPDRINASDGEAFVRYQVSCGKCALTYAIGGATEQKTARHLTGIAFVAQTGQHLYVSAQNTSGGNVMCRIFVNGKQVQYASSTGAFVIATCSAVAD